MIEIEVIGADVAAMVLAEINVPKLIDESLEEMAQELVGMAKTNLRDEPFNSYPIELEQSIEYSRPSKYNARVKADAGFAAYVEYGTGIVGRGSPHPEAAERGVVYDRNNHGNKGWRYFKKGKFRFTRGQTSKPFMYETAQQIPKLAGRVFGRRLKKMLNEARTNE